MHKISTAVSRPWADALCRHFWRAARSAVHAAELKEGVSAQNT